MLPLGRSPFLRLLVPSGTLLGLAGITMSEENKPKNELTVAEALNELKLLVKRFDERVRRIQRYSSRMEQADDEIEGQQKWVDKQRQSAKDILTRIHTIKSTIQQSNLETRIEYGGRQISIAEALAFKQMTFEMEKQLLGAFTPSTAEQQIRNMTNRTQISNETMEALKLTPHLFYDEKEIHEAREKLLIFHSNIDVLIEASNHRTVITLG